MHVIFLSKADTIRLYSIFILHYTFEVNVTQLNDMESPHSYTQLLTVM